MKSWKWLVVTLVVALLVVYYILGTDYLEQRRQNRSLASQIPQMEAALAHIPVPATGLEQELADALADLEAAEITFAGETDDTKIVESILRKADKTGVKAVPISTGPWGTESILGRDYAVFQLTISALGDLTHLQDFITQLETDEPETLVIEKLRVAWASSASGDNVTAEIEAVVYAPPPAAE